ncbi:MAG TPA: acylphosphatase [Candidatus Polarisedimenticolia bacterium]|jgi:acylphosphatase|nr:acylphosphatase [Candidatus Polarisedimenticolia bacterium]
MKASRFLVSGVVQGVGYRFFTVRAARGLGLKGFARNLSDGRVEVLAAGPAESVRLLREHLANGPRGAMVSGVEESEVEIDPDPSEFEVRY